MEYRKAVEKLMKHGKPQERKDFIRAWVDKIELAPDRQ